MSEDELLLARARLERLGSSFNILDQMWARPDVLPDLVPGVGSILLAHPGPFCGLAEGDPLPDAWLRTSPDLIPPQRHQPRRDRAKLPVLLVTRSSPTLVEALRLDLWTGYLLGDLIDTTDFCTRPLYYGGPQAGGFSFVHAYPDMPNARQITEDGLAVSANFGEAIKWVNEVGSSLRFKFAKGTVVWSGQEVEELHESAGVWLRVRASRDFILREPDSSSEEPLWAQLAELAGGHVAETAREHALLFEPDRT